MNWEADPGYERTIEQLTSRLDAVEKERDDLQNEVQRLTVLDEHSSATFDALVSYQDDLMLELERVRNLCVALESEVAAERAVPEFWRAEIARAGLHDLRPYEDHDGRWTVPLDDAEVQDSVIRMFLRLMKATAESEIHPEGVPQ